VRLLSRYWFHGLVIAAAVGAAFGYHAWQVHPPLVGVVESKVHRVGSREGGRVAELLVDVGVTVERDRAIARLDTSDLLAERRRLETELEYLEGLMRSDRRRFALEHRRLELQLETDHHWLAEQHADVQGGLAELATLNAEIERLREAEAAGLGRARDLTDLLVRRDAVARYVTERTKDVRTRPRRREGRDGGAVADGEVLDSMLGDRMERVHEVLRALVVLDQRVARRTVTSPCDGHVVEVLLRPGDVVPAFAPVVAVEDAAVAHATVFVPETQDTKVEVGDRVAVRSRRAGRFDTTGHVAYVYPGFSPLPPRLTFRGQVAWARKLRVRLPDGHTLVPGERVSVDLRPRADAGISVVAHAADAPVQAPPREGEPSPLSVPAALAARSRFEPSGLVWLPDLERYLVVSDDTGWPDRDDHAPWLFLVDAQGNVEASPLTLHGIDEVNDLEAVARGPGGRLLLLSSNAISKRGRRPASRQWLLEVERRGRSLTVTHRVALVQALVASHEPGALAALGIDQRAADGLPDVNFEGLAYRDGDLVLGLKRPVDLNGARILRIEDASALLRAGRVEPGRVSVFGVVDLRTEDGRARGISDLVLDGAGGFLALSTVPGAPDDEQVGGAHRITRGADGALVAKTLATWPGHKPEGISIDPAGRTRVVFDADSDTPAWIELGSTR